STNILHGKTDLTLYDKVFERFAPGINHFDNLRNDIVIQEDVLIDKNDTSETNTNDQAIT
ncbi:hypothetical protein COBT_003676, partial [Conglomerata obtusa]